MSKDMALEGTSPGPSGQASEATQLVTSEEQARAFIASVDDMVYFQGLDGSLKMLNDANARITGYSLEEFAADPHLWRTIVHPEDQKVADDFFAKYPEGTASFEVQYRLITKEGGQRWIQSRLVGIKDASGRYIGYNCIDRDITEQKQTETHLNHLVAELATANRTAEKANVEIRRLVALLSHDLRGPLLNVQCFLGELTTAFEALRRDLGPTLSHLAEEQRERVVTALDDEVPTALAFAETSARRIDALSTAVLELASAGSRTLQWERVVLDELIREILEGLAPQIQAGGAEVTVDPLPTVISDRFSLQRIFYNLLRNALQYLRPGRAGQITVSVDADPQEVRIRVQDNGRGIMEQDIPKAFAPGRRLDPQGSGSGMGLTYVQALVDQLQGRIECASALGEGTAFTVALPRRPHEESP